VTELVLGTAQLGFDGGYGITNKAGPLDPSTVRAMLETAVAGGITAFDTAEAYGDAERQLGEFMPTGAAARFITKLGLRDDASPDVPGSVSAALVRLGATRLHGVLLHRVDDLDDRRFPDLLAQLRDERDSGRVARIGVSVYDIAELERCVAGFPDLDILSFPGSIADRRILDHPLVAELHARGVECHVRSVFLQGLLLADPGRLSPPFSALVPAVRRLDEDAAVAGVSRLAWVLAGIRRPWVDAAAVGATSVAELEAILTAWAGAPHAASLEVDVPEDVLDPRSWTRRHDLPGRPAAVDDEARPGHE
jgi:aryl-alcohol dehydrogenase-like predicted oxidoreductase